MTDSEAIPPVSLHSSAFFFDLDGTLAAIEKRPEWVSIPDNIKQALAVIFSATGGALALISGRPLSELDALTAPLSCPAAGVHGAERRDATGKIHRIELSPTLISAVGSELRRALTAFPGCHVEEKGMAYALHYRQAERFKDQIEALSMSLLQRYPELAIQPGKCVFELKPRGADKGAAIDAFMHERPFVGKTPLFIGDDLTDEAGFECVNALGGLSIKVGPGKTAARFRLDGVDKVHLWLVSLAKQQENHSIKTIISVGEDL
ncbi:trehalose-phosphatase [Martelella alba]|uniref:Trehalose 6-phosphate phosphatase n=1 Tax=Martelella alba TaxID=2590451 RepID=A0ABY2SQR4_9HYPH|nr:trehalose-phosphatase [Martelella alba]TKI08316.1 trehalose-phosphatase [Martelella alba]